jgi:hypothetical protein
MLRIVLLIVGGLLIFVGTIWFLQGSGVLLGSPMSGQSRGQINGAGAAIGGLLIVVANWKRGSK